MKLECGTTADVFPVSKGEIYTCTCASCLHVFSFTTENIKEGVGDVMRINLFNGIKINGHDLSELKYTYDTALLSDTKEENQIQ